MRALHASVRRRIVPIGFCILVIFFGLSSCGYRLNVTIKGDGKVDVSPLMDQYAAGTQVTLTATPSAGGDFLHWGNDLTGSVNPVSLTMNSSNQIDAVFLPISLADGQVTITAYPPDTLSKGTWAYFTINLDLPAGSQYRAWIYYDDTTFTGDADSYVYSASDVLAPDATGVMRGAVPTIYGTGESATGSVTEWVLNLATWDGVSNTTLLTENFYYEVTWK